MRSRMCGGSPASLLWGPAGGHVESARRCCRTEVSEQASEQAKESALTDGIPHRKLVGAKADVTAPPREAVGEDIWIAYYVMLPGRS